MAERMHVESSSLLPNARLVAAALLLLVVLVSCASPDALKDADVNGDDSAWKRIDATSNLENNIRYFGFIDVTQDEEGESQYFEAGFAQFDSVAPLRVLLDSFKQAPVDTCDYHERAEGDNRPLEFPDEMALPDYPYKFISAGNRVDITHGRRRYARLTRTSRDADAQVQYETDVGTLPVAIGGLKLGDFLLKMKDLQAHTPGDEFPAFGRIAVPAIDRPKRFNLSIEDEVRADTRFRWTTGKYSDDVGVRVQIEAGGGGRALFCAALYDGEFQLPEAVQSSLGGRSIKNPSVYKDVVRFYVNDDVLLIVSQSSYY